MHLLATFAVPLAAAATAKSFFWDNDIFSHDNWEATMRFIRLVLTMGGALLLIAEARAHRLGYHISERTKKRFAIGVTVIAFLTYFDFFNPNVRYSEYYHRHEFYHYYLGSKYFKEVGYTRLYECTLVAEVDNGRRADVAKREFRDLSGNLIRKVSDTYILTDPDQCRKHFTPARWEAFRKDVNWFYESARGSYWENMQKDHGYNPPPVWTMEGKFFGSFGPASDGFFKILASIDVILSLGMVLMLGWAFGWRIMTVAAIFWGCNGPANFYWTGGAFLRQDWFFFLVAAVALARKRRLALAGAALTWSALLRVFPIIFFGGPLIIMAIEVMRRLRKQRVATGAEGHVLERPSGLAGLHPVYWLSADHRRFLFGCIVAGGLLVPASLIVAGPDSYKQFYSHISVHKNTPLTNTVGLETVLVHTWKGRMHLQRNDNMDDPFQEWKEGRVRRFHERIVLFWAIILTLGGWTVWSLRRTKLLWVGMALSLPVVFGLTNLTCYYYSMFILGAVLIRARPPIGPAFLAVSGASQVVLHYYYWVDDKYVAMSWLYLLLCVMLLYVYSRPFSLARLKAWWNREREPKSEFQLNRKHRTAVWLGP